MVVSLYANIADAAVIDVLGLEHLAIIAISLLIKNLLCFGLIVFIVVINARVA
jgi:hypothetical protein